MALDVGTSFRTTSELKSRIKFIAEKTHRSESFIINYLLEEYLDDVEDIFLSEQTLREIKAGKQKTYTAEEVYKELEI